MNMNFLQIRDLEQQFGSPFFLLDVNTLRNNHKKIDDAFRSRYPRFIIGYSYKTNYLPFLCKEMRRLGAYAEVVSRLEYDLALKIGVNPENIIFNGPLKTAEDVELALDNGSLLNIDSLYELEYIRDYCVENQYKMVKVGLRVNLNIYNNSETRIQEGYKISRFGICVSNGNFEYAINKLNKIKNLKIVGLHGHISTSERKASTYKQITMELCKLAHDYIGDSLEYIDIGGGIFGELPASFHIQAPSFDDYAEAVSSVLNQEFSEIENKPYLILEPGISMVANTFTFISKVVEVKKVQDKYFVLIDGSVHNIKPTLHKRNLPMEVVKQYNETTPIETYNVVGYTCMEKDYLAHNVFGELPEIGDYILFENVGAYTIVFNPPFIKERPGIVAVDHGAFFIVRRKETLNEFVNENLYVF